MTETDFTIALVVMSCLIVISFFRNKQTGEDGDE